MSGQLVYSKRHKMMIVLNEGQESERTRRVLFIHDLRLRGLIELYIDHYRQETVAKFKGVTLRAPIREFPTDTIFAQLAVVFG